VYALLLLPNLFRHRRLGKPDDFSRGGSIRIKIRVQSLWSVTLMVFEFGHVDDRAQFFQMDKDITRKDMR
jgi:hypothetical protein